MGECGWGWCWEKLGDPGGWAALLPHILSSLLRTPNHSPLAGYNESLGARELRRAVTRLVDDALSDALLRGEVRG